MSLAVLDTSVLIRYLVSDDATKAAAARDYIRQAPDRSLLMPDVALAELVFVLLRVYRWSQPDLANAIRAVVKERAIEVPGREIWLDVADDIERGRGPVDAYLLRTAERADIPEVVTFDRGMKPLAGVRCTAP